MTKARIQKWIGLATLALAFMLSLGLAANNASAGAPTKVSDSPAPYWEMKLNLSDRDTSGTGTGAALQTLLNPANLGDVLFTINTGTATSAELLVGVEYIGSGPNAGYYVTGRSSVDNIKKIYKLDTAGNFVTSTVQDACAGSTFGWRDMAYDGTNLVTADECGVDLVNPATGARVGGYALPSGALARSMAFNPATGNCFTANFNSAIIEFNCATGAVVNTFPANTLANYGFGWDAVSAGGPFLWSWAQQAPGGGACTGGTQNCLRGQRLSTTGAISGPGFDGVPVVGSAEIAGGADVDTVGGIITLIGLHQTASTANVVRGYDLRVTGVTSTPTNTPTPVNTFTPIATPTCLPQLVMFGGDKQQPVAPATGNSAIPAGNANSVAAVAIRNNPGVAEYMVPDDSFVLYVDDGSLETSIGFGNQTNGTEAPAIWLNRFTPGSPLQYPLIVQNISIFWPGQGANDSTFITETARLLIYQDTDGDGNPANATLLYQAQATTGVTGTFRTYNINPGISITAGDLYAGFEDQWAECASGGCTYQPQLFPASVDTSLPHRNRSWIAGMGTGANPDITTLSNNTILATIENASGGALTGNWGIRVSGDDNRAPHCAPTSTPAVPFTVTNTRTPPNTATPTETPTATPTPICPGSWTQQAVYPAPVLDEAVAVQGGILYSFGGVVTGAISANAYKYDPVGNTWTAITALPSARENPSAVSDGTNIYVLGGSDSTGALTNTLWRYNPGLNTYTTLTPYTTATWAQSAAYVSGKIYKLGGCSVITGNACTTITNVMEAYDIAGGTWSTVASYPESRFFMMAVGLGGFVYGAGGINNTDSSLGTYRYDPVGNTWNDALIANLPATRWGAASDALQGKWVLAGGFEGVNDDITPSAVSWDSGSNTWTRIDNMLQPRARLAGGAIGAAYYAVGGSGIPFSFTGTTDNQRYINICAPSGIIHGHLTWAGVAAANRPNVTGTLTLCVTGAPQAFSFTTDTATNFTITTGLPNGTYNWVVKGGRHISNSSPSDGTALTITGGSATQEFGTQKGGNTNADNIVNATDFNALKTQFGQAGVKSADADYNLVVNASDFNIQKNSFGQAGHAITCP